MKSTTELLKSQEVAGKKTRFSLWLWALVPTALWGQMLLPLTAWGQAITPDGSLGTQVMQNGDNYRIEGGTPAGGNLFHSFQEFSVPTGGEAFFNNAADVDNILSRVTGGNVSDIDGLIRANGSANLFLINPAGIVFGPNARLDIGGSFLGSTASGMLFPDGTEFNATNQGTPLLTINAPIGLQFRGNEGNVVNQSQVLDINGQFILGLEVQPGKNLGLVGGDVSLDGGTITARGGRVELGGLAAAGTVGLNDDGSLSFPDGVARGDVLLRNFAFIGVGAGGGGSIAVNADNLDIWEGSRLVAGISDSESQDARAGDITINATGAIAIDGSLVANLVGEGAIGNAGDVEITGRSVSITNDARLLASTSGRGDAGNVTIEANERISLNRGFVSSTVFSEAMGNGGEINIMSGTLSLKNRAQVSSSIFGKGNGGRISVQVDGAVELSNVGSAILSTVEAGGEGDTGGIELSSESLLVTDGAQLLSTVREASENNGSGGRGNGGNIKINVSESVTFAGLAVDDTGAILPSRASSDLRNGAVGTAGNIEITAKRLSVMNGARVSASTSGQGDAGMVSIEATDLVELSGNTIAISSNIENGGVGNSGGININARSMSVADGTQLQTLVRGKNEDGPAGQGIAGDIKITVDENVSFIDSGSGAFSSLGSISEQGLVEGDAIGQGGNINITAGSLLLGDGAFMSASTLGEGDAGKVRIEADGEVRLEGGDISSTVETGAVGTGGSIDITASSLSLSNGAILNTSTLGQGDAGIISVQVPEGLISLEDSNIVSNVANGGVGNSGGININARSLSVTDGAQLQTIVRGENEDGPAGQGRAGDINITVEENVSFVGSGSRAFSTLGSRFEGVQPGAVGQGGNINITAGSLSLSDGGGLEASTLGEGDAGKVVISSDGEVKLEGGEILSTVETGAVGTGGSIEITARSLSLSNGAVLSTDSFGEGDAGIVSIKATESVELSGTGTDIFSDVNTNAIGNAGGILIETGSLSVTEGAQLSSSTFGQGNAGSVRINATDRVDFDGTDSEGNSSAAFSTVLGEAVGTGGSIDITARSLSMTKGALITTLTAGQGADAGNIQIDVEDLVLVSGGSGLSSDSLGEGNAGNITINAGNTVSFDGGLVDENGVRIPNSDEILTSSVASSSVLRLAELVGTGKGGDITINTGSLFVTNGAVLRTSTIGEGDAADAGNIIIRADDLVFFEGDGSSVFTSAGGLNLGFEVSGDGGNIDIHARSLSLTGGAELISQTFGSGKAGDIQVNATEAITISGVAPIQEDESGMVTGGFSSGLIASTEENATGSGGTIEVMTGTLRLSDGGVLSGRSRSRGDGGNIIVNVDNLELTGGGQIVTTAFSTGAAGSITVNAAGGRVTASGSDPTFQQRFDRLDVAFNNGQTEFPAQLTIDPVDSASGLFAQSQDPSGTGSGDITIVAESLSLADGAEVTVSNAGTRTGGIIEIKETGNVEVNASEIILNNGTLNADTAAGQGNIDIRASERIELRNDSTITASATGTAEGGNITISTDFLVAFPGNNDIRANAQNARGGQVEITADNVVGIEFREQPNDRTNDITATSQFGPQGNVTLNTFDTDIRQGFVELSENVVDTEALVAQACRPNREGGSSFVVTGRGGIAPTPTDPLTDDTIRIGGRVVAAPRLEDLPDPEQIVTKVERTEEINSDDLQPARGWLVNEKGNIVLTPYPTPNVTGRHPGARPGCGPVRSQR